MLKNFFITISLGIVFILFVAIFIGGIGNNIGYGNKNNNEVKKYDINTTDIVFDKNNSGGATIKVYITKEKKIKKLSLEEYIRGVVPAEMPAEFGTEALKAQAVAARTFAVAHMESYGGKKYPGANGADVTDTVNCQVYMDKNSILNKWPKNLSGAYWNKITDAVQQTNGQVLKYNGKLITEPYYFAISSGKTENSKDILGKEEPYLKSVSSPGEEIAKKYKSQIKLSYSSFISKVKSQYSNSNLNSINVRNSINIISRTEAGSVKEIKVGNNTMTGPKFRTMLGLNSANFSINYNSTGIEINCVGYGHDVGMSQWGANVMSKQGKNYKDILTHYYDGVTIEKL
ncbi:stage II sporulation protein D [Clostridium sp.]|uniref:stage II sporulation protein D n=1 Tax=Clostridium sp. TaxID=1506 RepID=UPI00258CA657|nr:stage II sporulation protein D [Clostridium sp.]MDF2503788.1 stage sporulation protein [Clostridium sp.]